jgi:hypothetical protein
MLNLKVACASDSGTGQPFQRFQAIEKKPDSDPALDLVFLFFSFAIQQCEQRGGGRLTVLGRLEARARGVRLDYFPRVSRSFAT